MIPCAELQMKIGKKAFKELALKQPGQTMASLEKRRRWGKGTTVMSICQHGNIEKPPEGVFCETCLKETPVTKTPDFQPHYNLGLGGWVESKQDLKKTVKDKKLIPLGDQIDW